jgi:hypothetical protein
MRTLTPSPQDGAAGATCQPVLHKFFVGGEVNLVKQDEVDFFKRQLTKLFAHETICSACRTEKDRAVKEQRDVTGFVLCPVHRQMRRSLAKDEKDRGMY